MYNRIEEANKPLETVLKEELDALPNTNSLNISLIEDYLRNGADPNHPCTEFENKTPIQILYDKFNEYFSIDAQDECSSLLLAMKMFIENGANSNPEIDDLLENLLDYKPENKSLEISAPETIQEEAYRNNLLELENFLNRYNFPEINASVYININGCFETPLSIAAKNNNTKLVKIILQQNETNPNLKIKQSFNEEGLTVYDRSAFHLSDDPESILIDILLIEYGASNYKETKKGEVCYRTALEFIQSIINRGMTEEMIFALESSNIFPDIEKCSPFVKCLLQLKNIPNDDSGIRANKIMDLIDNFKKQPIPTCVFPKFFDSYKNINDQNQEKTRTFLHCLNSLKKSGNPHLKAKFPRPVLFYILNLVAVEKDERTDEQKEAKAFTTICFLNHQCEKLEFEKNKNEQKSMFTK